MAPTPEISMMDACAVCPCISCDYDLAGLEPDGMCPECGASISVTLDHLSASRRIERGMISALSLTILGLVGWLVSVSAAALLHAMYLFLVSDGVLKWLGQLKVTALLASCVCFFLAWVIAGYGPSDVLAAKRSRSPKVVMCSGAIFVLGGLAVITFAMIVIVALADLSLGLPVWTLFRSTLPYAVWMAPIAVTAHFIGSARAHYFGPRSGLFRLVGHACVVGFIPFVTLAIFLFSVSGFQSSGFVRRGVASEWLAAIPFVICGLRQVYLGIRLVADLRRMQRGA